MGWTGTGVALGCEDDPPGVAGVMFPASTGESVTVLDGIFSGVGGTAGALDTGVAHG